MPAAAYIERRESIAIGFLRQELGAAVEEATAPEGVGGAMRLLLP